MYPWGTKNLRKKIKSFQKDYWKQGPILTLQKFLTNIWLRFHVCLFYLVFQPMFSHNKQFGVEFNMNSWFFYQSNRLTSPFILLQKSIIYNECITFKT
jgi:hypothetical protein